MHMGERRAGRSAAVLEDDRISPAAIGGDRLQSVAIDPHRGREFIDRKLRHTRVMLRRFDNYFVQTGRGLTSVKIVADGRSVCALAEKRGIFVGNHPHLPAG